MPHLVEECYEVLDALSALDGRTDVSGASAHLEEELGDLLFQIVFHARLADEAGRFDLADVARGVHDKLVHRHPHVFGDVDADSADEVVSNWEAIKKSEKGRSSVTEGIPAALPALMLTGKLARKARSVGVEPEDATGEQAAVALDSLTRRARRRTGGSRAVVRRRRRCAARGRATPLHGGEPGATSRGRRGTGLARPGPVLAGADHRGRRRP